MLWAFFDNKGVCFGAYKTQFQQPRQAFSAPLPGSVTGAPHPPSHYTHTFTHMYMLNEYKKQSKWPKMEPTMKKYRARTYARTAEWLQLSNPSRHKIWISSHKYPSGWLLARSLARFFWFCGKSSGNWWSIKNFGVAREIYYLIKCCRFKNEWKRASAHIHTP